MTLQELMLCSMTSDTNYNKQNKKAVRESVKLAISLYQEDKLSNEMLKAIASLAMAWELSTDIDRKLGNISKRCR